AAGCGDGRMFGVTARSEGVRGAVLDDVDLRDGQTRADAEVLDDAVEFGFFFSRHFVRLADGEGDAGTGVIAEERVGAESDEEHGRYIQRDAEQVRDERDEAAEQH